MNEAPETQYGNSEPMQSGKARLAAGTPRWVPLALIVLAAASMMGLAVAWNATKEAKQAEAALATAHRDTKVVGQDIQLLDQRLTQEERTNTALQNQLLAVTDKLKMTQDQIITADAQNGKIRDNYSNRLNGIQSELATKANVDDVRSLGGDVNDVKGQLQSTKSSIDATRTEFSTLIARNHDEIDELRRMGERNYLDFTLNGKGDRSKVGGVMVELRGTNVKKNQFTVALYVDDLRLEKKDRAINEPIYFYTPGTRVPSELVVNQIGKNKVVGYVSITKAQPAR